MSISLIAILIFAGAIIAYLLMADSGPRNQRRSDISTDGGAGSDSSYHSAPDSDRHDSRDDSHDGHDGHDGSGDSGGDGGGDSGGGDGGGGDGGGSSD